LSDMYSYVLSVKGQICCMCILLYIAWTYFIVKRRKTRAHRLFSAMIIVSIVYMVFDMITVYTINHVEDFSFAFNHFVHVIFMSMMCSELYLVYMYIRTLALEEQAFRYPDLIPLGVAIAGSIFLKFDYVKTPYGNYSWGSYAFVVFASGYLYFFAGMYLLFKRRKYIEVKASRAIFMAMMFQLTAVIAQGIYPTLLISNIGITVIVVSLFYSVESPDAILIEMLADERAKADSANQAKSMFLAQMSHDIRTPMNAVLGMNEMILREAKDPDILEYAANIQDSGRTLLTIINSILDFSKIEDGKMEILSVEYDTARVFNNLVLSIADRAGAKGLKLNVNIDERLPRRLKGDDVRLTQVIMNLLTNAVKYTQKGSVTLTVRLQECGLKEVDIYVSVEDTGIGIKEKDMDKLMASFSRIDEERNHHVEGTGLGMTIVDRLLKMMGSGIEVESEYGKGSVFSFVIRQEIIDPVPIGDYRVQLKETKRPEGADTTFRAPQARILIVDDNEMNLKVIRNLLKKYDITPDLVSSGEKALEMVKKKTYHLIGLDHMMPDMDGIETLEIMRHGNLLPDDTVVIVMTANAVTGAKEKYLEAGFDDYVTKPIEIPELERKLKAYLPEKVIMMGDAEESTHKKTLEMPEAEEIMEFAPYEEDGSRQQKTPDNVYGRRQIKDTEDILNTLREKGIDVTAGLNYCASETGLYLELLDEFINSAKEKLDEMATFLQEENWSDYEIRVHAMKSSAKTIGANETSEKARMLEEAAQKEDVGFIKANHPVLIEMVLDTITVIKEAERD